MSTIRPKFIGDHAEQLQKDHVFFANLNLDRARLNQQLAPIIEHICHRIELSYKSPAKVAFLGAYAFTKERLSESIQFDDVCIKLLHVESGLDLYVTLRARLARTLLIRLLSSTLIDDSHGLLFSSTEKGIFSFVVARLLFDLKNALLENMPDLKLVGIYHCQDDLLQDADISGFGIYNFSCTFAADIYPVTIALPHQVFKTPQKPEFDGKNLFARSGHLKRPAIFTLKTLSIAQGTLHNLSFGDLIIFDHASLTFSHGALSGPIHVKWHDQIIRGTLSCHDEIYRLSFERFDFFSTTENGNMEELDIRSDTETVAFDESVSNKTLINLSKNIRVQLSIELSRLPMTLKELCEIKEGEIINLHRKIEDPLEMVVEGKVIGYCQPVQIDGRLGIRVLSIDSDKNQQS